MYDRRAAIPSRGRGFATRQTTGGSSSGQVGAMSETRVERRLAAILAADVVGYSG
jgi:hypothetical protein